MSKTTKSSNQADTVKEKKVEEPEPYKCPVCGSANCLYSVAILSSN